jgi:hypothetical protein
MPSDLYTKYGYCEIPTGTRLYRSNTGYNSTDQLFFSTNFNDAWIWGGDMEIWTTKKNIKVLFLLQHIDSAGKGRSTLPKLYYDLYPGEQNRCLDELDIKQDIRRDPFAKQLLLSNVYGWFSTIEDGRTGFEICLFNQSGLSDYFDCVPVSRNASELYSMDSITDMKFFPDTSFYNTSSKLIRSSPGII